MHRQPMVFAGVTRALLRSAELISLSREALITSAGLDEQELDAVDGRIPQEHHLALWQRIRERKVDPCFGLYHGEWTTPAQIGVAGYAALSSPTLGAALSSISHFSKLITEFLESSYHRQNPGLGTVITLPRCPLSDDMADASVAGDVCMARLLTRRHIRPREVWLQRKRPSQLTEYERVFDCRILFEQRQNAVLFEPEALELPLPSADPLLHVYLGRAFATDLLRQSAEQSFFAEVESAVLEQIAQGDVRIERVAQRLGMSVRTLQRRLKERCLEYQMVVDTCRQRLATELLGDALISSMEISCRLGFSEPSAFRRAFKRWTGQSPSGYRRASLGRA